jgi:hypothetical protein
MNFHSTFSRYIILNQTSLFSFFWSLEGIHDGQENHCGDESILNVLGRTEGNQHDREETESLAVEGGLKILWNLDRVTREETLVQDDEGEEDRLRLDDGFSWCAEWSKEV